jgi:hypothetical protein
VKTLSCDVCKKAIENPSSGRTYWHLANFDLCEPCKDKLDLSLKGVIRTKNPFNYEWYDRVMLDSIGRATKSGKFN